jgi:hypothetical protein
MTVVDRGTRTVTIITIIRQRPGEVGILALEQLR